MRIANTAIDFPEGLLAALRDGRLVVFAGAGVSMGAPANLPSFRELARRAADGATLAIGDAEAEDRFLGRLEASGAEVHRIASLLLKSDAQPAELHRSLLRLYTKAEDVRIVTTNFDRLFEQAFAEVFNTAPRVLNAPDLPLARRLRGIAHIHGTVCEPSEMVLTDRDFGRAYLTESAGWARRFLVELFNNFDVLFIGYSHNDAIMHYLSTALPRDNNQSRYVLIGDKADTPERWKNLGIEPIVFHQDDKNDFSELEQGIASLARHVQLRILDWRSEIGQIAGGTPPVDEVSAGVIDYALTDPVLTRFFVDAASSPEWIDWLDARKHLSSLFVAGSLNEQQIMLARWLAARFAAENSDALFSLIRRHGGYLNPQIWHAIAWQISKKGDTAIYSAVLSRWVAFLMNDTPFQIDEFTMLGLAEACAASKALTPLLMVYDAMTAIINRPLTHGIWENSQSGLYYIHQMLTECLNPNLPEIAEPLLELTTRRLAERHFALKAWGDSDQTWESDNFGRSAIEPHEQDEYPKICHPLIDLARDCLEWLAGNRADVARLWSERHAASEAPLLRRLAVHTLAERTDLSADDKLAWLLEYTDIHEMAAHHELFRAARRAYPQAGPIQRREFINAVRSYRWPNETDADRETRSAHHHFTWLYWLGEAAPGDALIAVELESIREQNPEFRTTEHPDFTHYLFGLTTVHGAPSPWSVSEMLDYASSEWLPQVLELQLDERAPHPRHQVIDNIAAATEQQPAWGTELAAAMAQAGAWDTSIWRGVMDGWQKAKPNETDLAGIITAMSATEIYDRHSAEVAYTLFRLLENNRNTYTDAVLDAANRIARQLWQYVPTDDSRATPSDWTILSLNHIAGHLAQFWVYSIDCRNQLQESPPAGFSSVHETALSEMMADEGSPGKLARVILALYLPYFTYVDEAWVKINLIPLLSPDHAEFESAWHGLMHCGRITPKAGELLHDAFLTAIEHIGSRLDEKLRRPFVHQYTILLARFVDSPSDEWITQVFASGNSEIRRLFAEHIGHSLRASDETQRKAMWDTWLRGYWQNRLLGIPAPLDDAEIEHMLRWTCHLDSVYPDAVALAVQMRPVRLPYGGLILRSFTDSELLANHPEAVAKFVIHLSKANHENYFMWYGARNLMEQLMQSDLSAETAAELAEVVALIAIK